jgi:hypothetical protein
MRHFIADDDAVAASRKALVALFAERAPRDVEADIGMNRFIDRTR